MNINILVERGEEERRFFRETEERFNKATQLKVFINEMTFKTLPVYPIEEKEEVIHFLKVSLIPPFWLFIPELFLLTGILFGFRLWYIIPGAFSLLCAFIWSPFLFTSMIKKGLRRAGYIGVIKFISHKKILKEFSL